MEIGQKLVEDNAVCELSGGSRKFDKVTFEVSFSTPKV
jgi:hypothetical protein